MSRQWLSRSGQIPACGPRQNKYEAEHNDDQHDGNQDSYTGYLAWPLNLLTTILAKRIVGIELPSTDCA